MNNDKWDIGTSNARQSKFMHEHQNEPNVAGPEDNDEDDKENDMKTVRLAPSIMTDNRYDSPKGWHLVDTKTLKEIKVGDKRTLEAGEEVKITWLNPPHKPSSQGKVSVEFIGRDWSQEFYASVIGAEYQYEGDTS